jgi:hypothetical protein
VAEVPKKSGMPMALVAGVAVVVLGAGGWFVMKQMGGSGTQGSDSTRVQAPAGPSSQSTQNPQAAGGLQNAPTEPRGGATNLSAKTQAVPGPGATGGRTGGGPEVPAAGAADVSAAGEVIGRGDKPSAQTGLASLRQIMPRLRAHDDSVDAWYHMAEAYAILDDGEGTRACPVLSRIRGEEKRIKGVEAYWKQLDCK